MPRALFLRTTPSGVTPAVEPLSDADLPDGEVRIDVAYSSLNYKDGLAITGKGKVVRGAYPFVPGIDLAGTVATSDDPRFAPGDAVVLTGYGTGEERWGGYATRARAHADHLVTLPDGLDLKTAMVLGTAGFTAMLAVQALEDHGVHPDSGEVAVTGATGGVGSLAVCLLSDLGYHVAAVTGSLDQTEYLLGLGATTVVPRSEVGALPARPLGSARWAGAVDTVGGAMLANLLAHTRPHGAVTACGNAGGHDLPTTVLPFILRGVSLLGIDSNTCPMPQRAAAWERLATLIDADDLDSLTTTISLDDLPAWAERITTGQTRGRVVVGVRRVEG